ncbi:hypothetical protein EC968_009381, partial [Mortierella alpina]
MRVKTSRDFADRIRNLKEWILAVVSEVDVDFACWLLEQVVHKPNVATSIYVTEFQLEVATNAHAVLSLGSEELLNDEVITAILLFFQRIYGHKGSLFLSPTGLLYGDQWTYGKERVLHSKRLFTVVHMTQYTHWGAACFDLERRTIAFGDSLEANRYPVPIERLRVIVNWLKSLTGPERWDEALANVEKFKVPQQQDGVSCGIMATTAIEQAVNDYFAGGEVVPASARIRYLRLLMGYTKLEDDHIVKAYREHVPDDPSIITPEEDLSIWFDSMVANLDEVDRRGRIKPGPKTPGWKVLNTEPAEEYDDHCLMEPLDASQLSYIKQLDEKLGRTSKKYEKHAGINKQDGTFSVKSGLKQEMLEETGRDHATKNAPIKIHVLASDSDSDTYIQCGPETLKIDDDVSYDDDSDCSSDNDGCGDDGDYSTEDNDERRTRDDNARSGDDSDGSSSDDDGSSSDDQKNRDEFVANTLKRTQKVLDIDWPNDVEEDVIAITQISDEAAEEDVEDVPPVPAIHDQFPDLEAAMSSFSAYAHHAGFKVVIGRSEQNRY